MSASVLRIAGPPTDATPIVLVHGYGGVKSQWFRVERTLRDAGFTSVHTLTYNAFSTDIPTLAARLVDTVHALRVQTGAEKVHLIGHSLGGVIIRYAVSVLGLDPVVGTAITVASPHGGSRFARLGFGATAAQLRPGSAVLRQIEAAARPGSARWIAYYSNLDVVAPAARGGRPPPAPCRERVHRGRGPSVDRPVDAVGAFDRQRAAPADRDRDDPRSGVTVTAPASNVQVAVGVAKRHATLGSDQPRHPGDPRVPSGRVLQVNEPNAATGTAQAVHARERIWSRRGDSNPWPAHYE